MKDFTEIINGLEKEIEKNLPEKAQILLPKNGGLKGIGVISAAIIYVETKGKNVEFELASYAGITPVENSSGKYKKYHNNKKGNRKLNCVFYRLSIHQSIHDEKGNLLKVKQNDIPVNAFPDNLLSRFVNYCKINLS